MPDGPAIQWKVLVEATTDTFPPRLKVRCMVSARDGVEAAKLAREGMAEQFARSFPDGRLEIVSLTLEPPD